MPTPTCTKKRMIGAIADRENPFRPVREILDASQHSLSWPLQARSAAGGIAIKMQRQSIIREDVCFVDRSRRGELPGSGVTSSTPYRAGPSAEDPAGTLLPTSPAADRNL
jgi:hypothetical protein